MKQLLLCAVLLCGIGSDCLALDQQDKVAIVAGTAVAVGLWSWWGHVSNKNAIKRAEHLWQECHAFVGGQEDGLSNDLQKSLYILESCPILKRQYDIVAAYESLSLKMDWFWNRSNRMRQAFVNCKMLKKSLDAYRVVFNTVKQQLAAHKVAVLRNSFSQYDLAYDPSRDVIKSTTLQKLSEHSLLLNGGIINDLYKELLGAQAYCYEFAQAHKEIIIIKKAYDRWLTVCDQIRKYDDIVEKYQDFMLHMYQPCNKQDFVADARRNSSGEFPLLNFVKVINVDIENLSRLTLDFSYIRFQNGGVIASHNALTVVEQHLRMVSAIIMSSRYYQDELRYYHEKLRLQEEQRRLAAEQQRLQANINKVNHEIDDLKYENWRLRDEMKNKQNK